MLWSWSCGRLKNCGCGYAEVQFRTNISWQSCGYAVVEVLLQVAKVRLRQKKICTCPPLQEVTIHNIRVICASYLGWTVYTTCGSVFINWVHCGLCTAHGVPCVHQLQFNVSLICSLVCTPLGIHCIHHSMFYYGHFLWFIVITN
jgi:hypothetical protein